MGTVGGVECLFEDESAELGAWQLGLQYSSPGDAFSRPINLSQVTLTISAAESSRAEDTRPGERASDSTDDSAEATMQACVDETSSAKQRDKTEAFVEFNRLDARPELDGLRAVAVIPVVLTHWHFKCNFPGGFAGVDVFFVISGYLVTAILLYELSVDKFSYPSFLLRRVRRLFPAMVVLLVVLLIVSWHRLLAEAYSKTLKQTWAVIIFGANVHFYHQDDYFRALVGGAAAPLLVASGRGALLLCHAALSLGLLVAKQALLCEASRGSVVGESGAALR